MLKWIRNKYVEWKLSRYLAPGEGINDITIDALGLVSKNKKNSTQGIFQEYNLIKHAVQNLKHKIKTLSENDSLISTLEKNKEDLIHLINEKPSLEQKYFYDKYVFTKPTDLNNSKEKESMIDTRIGHFKLLQVKKQIRSINRQLRQALKNNDKEKIEYYRKEINELRRTLSN